MIKMKLKDVKIGDVFRRNASTTSTWVRGTYNREGGFNRYSVHKWDDYNYESFLKGSTLVYVGFTF